jgi:hypothetical protein
MCHMSHMVAADVANIGLAVSVGATVSLFLLLQVVPGPSLLVGVLVR